MSLSNCHDHTDKKVKIDGMYEMAHNTTCTLEHRNEDMFSVACIDGVLFISSNEYLTRKKRQVSPFEVANSPSVSGMGGFTASGAMIGSAFGPIGLAVGAGIGVIVDVVCAIVCRHDNPPLSNKPPTITKPAVLPKAILAKEGETTARVKWYPPTITDPEDGDIKAVAYPPNFINGGQYSEGNYVVYFVGTDSGGLSATTSLSFQVKLHRCGFPRWPENGYIDCGGSDIIYGTICKIRCKSGFTISEGNKPSLKCVKNGAWMPPYPSNCKPRVCAKVPTISHGEVQCRNGKQVGNICEVVCDYGYQVHGMRIVGCDNDGTWGIMPVCYDVLPPRFLAGDCPDDIQVYIDSANNTAKVTWNEPRGDDNSREPVTITEVHGHKPEVRLTAGLHSIKYTITDKAQNRGDNCVFNIQVVTLSCSPPNLRVAGGDHLKYDCPSYNLGAECSMSCMSGYPMGGETKIQCSADYKSRPPKLDWKWQEDGLEPFCKETNCSRDALNEPVNGALACSQWTHGQMCQMQCGAGYDIPNIGDGLFVCGRSTGKWRPSAEVPDCDTKLDVNNMNLPNEFYYYTGNCNSSTENLYQIKENFVQALNTSNFWEYCVDISACQARFVDVTCGPVSSRRKRDINFRGYRRSVPKFAYRLRFEFILPYKLETGKSADDIFAENEDRLYKMSDVIQKEVDSGHFDLHVDDLYIERDSYGPGVPSMICPSGTFPRKESASCVGCPKGSFAKTNGRCVKCPLGTYQNLTNSLKCEACPTNTNTTEIGAEDISQCLRYCVAGEFSPNTLAPCTKCPCNSFQTYPKSVSCTRCASNKRSPSDGATSVTQCQAYDVQLSDDKIEIENKLKHDIITMFMWVYVTNNETNSAVEFENSDSRQSFGFRITPTVSIGQSHDIVSTGNTLQTSIWTSIALIVDKPSSEVKVYVNGKVSYANSSFLVLKSHTLDRNDLIRFYGEIKISAFWIIPRKATPSDISSWSTSCLPPITGTIYSMDNLAASENVKVVIPSVCDAIDECENSPCNSHQCINERGGYKCICSSGFSGEQCQLLPDYCTDNNCKNGATCVNGTGNYTCKCPYGYRGDLCEIKAVDGGWSAWTNWTTCSKLCDRGTAKRTRRCDSPSPDTDGKQCQGNSSEETSCNEEKCPECSKLRRTYGLIITCNKTSERQRCFINCRAGLYFTNAPLSYYECGLATGYKWNHQNEKNPSGRLPSCSELEPPVVMGVKFEGNYDSIPCTDSNKQIVQDSIDIKLSTLGCKKTSTCETSIPEPVCINSGKKRSTGSSMKVTVRLQAAVNSKGNTFNIVGLLQNNSAPSKQLRDFVNQTLELERSAQTLMNRSVDFFQVTVADGTKHSLSSSSDRLTYKPDIRCPSGMVRIEVFCAVCPAGSYSDGQIVTMCPRGQYQDATGQSACKPCPSGKTTTGIGSIHGSECSVDDNTNVKISDNNGKFR
ncbi:sushi, von Willebrand factor type A, EGF and pentraxin domain-containing protein 1-like isoform X2 [Ruditapes philippinarum]|nr:sushi, von Willebrand factor type A, EGF and pentraxin domain-containing protein 1-like isoform X2 [Ruditapes philippinarum]